jgi:hypothetical protein
MCNLSFNLILKVGWVCVWATRRVCVRATQVCVWATWRLRELVPSRLCFSLSLASLARLRQEIHVASVGALRCGNAHVAIIEPGLQMRGFAVRLHEIFPRPRLVCLSVPMHVALYSCLENFLHFYMSYIGGSGCKCTLKKSNFSYI